MGELVHRGGGVIMPKMWWIDWGPQVVGGWSQVWWVVRWLGKDVVMWLEKGVVGWLGPRGGALVSD